MKRLWASSTASEMDLEMAAGYNRWESIQMKIDDFLSFKW